MLAVSSDSSSYSDGVSTTTLLELFGPCITLQPFESAKISCLVASARPAHRGKQLAGNPSISDSGQHSMAVVLPASSLRRLGTKRPHFLHARWGLRSHIRCTAHLSGSCRYLRW